jgi:hypothetical protein
MHTSPITIITYVLLSLLFAVAFHRTLKRYGRVFLEELLRDNPAAGSALERLLDLCYALFNLGYVAFTAATLTSWSSAEGAAAEAIRDVAGRLGFQMMLLSVAHGVNVWLFSRKVGRAMRANQRELEELLRS